jgi:KDO2-lipid IV(A) lauroyltransferase
LNQTLRLVRRRVKDAFYGASLRLLRARVARLSDDAAWRLGIRLGSVCRRVASREAERAKANLALAFPDRSSQDIEAMTRLCFAHLAVNVVEILRFERLGSETIRDTVEFVGAEHLDAALQKGKGCIVLTAHVGNWELLAAALAHHGFRTDAIVRELRSRSLNRMLTVQRTLGGYRPLSRTADIREAIRSLRDNRLLGVLPDVDTAVASVFVEFFGRPAATPVGPVMISRKFGAAVVPIFIRRVDRFRHRVEAHPALEWYESGNARHDLVVNVQKYTSLIEAQIRLAPEQWIWMHERWKRQPDTAPVGS